MMKKQQGTYKIRKVIFLLTVLVALFVGVFWGIRKFTAEYYFKNTILNNVEGVSIVVESKLFSDFPIIGSEVPYKSVTIVIPDLARGKEGEDSNNVINNDILSSGIKKWIRTMYQRDEAKKFTDKLVVKYRDDTIIGADLTKKESKEND